jgi:hypothetical protein
MGMSCRRVGLIPAKSRPRGTRGIFKKLEPRLEEAKSGQRAFFVDAAHFVLGAYLGFFCGVLNACLSNLSRKTTF